MKKWERSAQARRALDRRFATRDFDQLRHRPPAGWIKSIRNALGMSQADLGGRLEVTSAAVAGLERSEREEGISLRRLSEIAQALDCNLLYLLVPNTTLEDTVQREAGRRAAESLGYVSRTMGLEAQGLEATTEAEILQREIRRVIEEQRVWRST